MIRRVLSFGTIEAFARGFNWLLLIALPFLLTAEEYGVVGLIAAAEGLIVTVALLGQDRSIMRFYNDSGFDRPALLGSVAKILFAASTVSFLIVGVIQLAGAEEVGGMPTTPHLWFLALLVAGSLLLRYFWAYARVVGDAIQFLVSRAGISALKLVTVLGLAWVWRSSESYPIGAAVATLAGGVTVSLLWPIKRSLSENQVLRQLLVFGWPFVFHAVSGNLLMVADRFMIEAFLSEADVGIYTFAYGVGASLSFVFGSLVVYLEPQIYKAHGDPGRTSRLLDIFLGTSAIGGIAVGILLVAAVGPLALRYLSPEYGEALGLIPIIVGAHVLSPIYLASSYRLTNHKKTGTIAIASGSAAVANVVLNLILIPSMGIRGAAIATFASYLFLAALITIFSERASRTGSVGLQMMGLTLVAAIALSFVSPTTVSLIPTVLAAGIIGIQLRRRVSGSP